MVILLGLVVVAVLSVLNAAPLTFFSMLFFGNVGVHWGFLDILPGAIAIYCIKNSLFSYNNKIKGNK